MSIPFCANCSHLEVEHRPERDRKAGIVRIPREMAEAFCNAFNARECNRAAETLMEELRRRLDA